jgi:hypothetical protein
MALSMGLSLLDVESLICGLLRPCMNEDIHNHREQGRIWLEYQHF